ncbi:hypothetical protein KJI95_11260 [Shewanella sp. JM162201]|uniref:AlgX/AlgJ SGNH hydrolase-like domain-containing protein n=1 Tax=Shewanella jiangmenensis TaxID=2837387 RepID=A0ABS5V3S5_9GAMM|nr:hypothetical protein [Shewanella jiangmenensis]MBT1445098.1 hypothetical protein [Shewanella jiangmenensis]
MYPVMTKASRCNGVLFILMLSAMFLYSVPSLLRFTDTQQLAWDKFSEGELLREFEQFYDKQLFYRDAAIRHWANLQFHLFGEGARGVVFGRDGWLFTGQEFLIPNNLDANIERQLARIVAAKTALAARGKTLVILPVPMKVDIYRGHAQRAPSAVQLGLYDDFVARLRELQLTVVPVRQAFLDSAATELLYVPNDSHWTPAGARLAAAELGKALQSQRGSDNFVTQEQSREQFQGDLVNFLKFDPSLAPEYFRPWLRPVFETVRQSDADADLFADVSHRVALLGTSYTAMEAWNFAGFLQQQLAQELLTQAYEGAGPFKAMDEFLAGELNNNPELELVVWEFPVRTLLADREGQAGTF